MTDRYALIGHPVGHSRSPFIHARFAQATGQDMQYGLIDPGSDGFTRAVDEFRASGGRGLNVTLPFKEQAFAYSERTSERAAAAQAVNTLALDKGYGDNTDGVGLIRDLTVNLATPVRGKRILLMGAGGAARGVLPALVAEGASHIVIANRAVERAEALAQRAAGNAEGCGYHALPGRTFDIVINATSAGLSSGVAPALPAGLLQPGVLAYDMVYGTQTQFMTQARGAGARICDGLGMLVEQAAESFFVWRGVRPETSSLLRDLRGG